MKILFCTNVYDVVENGPVKFSRMLPEINDFASEHELHILSEDVQVPSDKVHHVDLGSVWKKSIFSQFIRMWVYHKAAMRLRAHFPFDVLIYNNALVGLYSAFRFPGTVGMINDYNNLHPGPNPSKSFTKWLKTNVFRGAEKIMARRSWKVIVNSDYLMTQVIKAYKLTPEKVFRLYKGISIPAHIPALNPIDPSAPVKILFVKNDYLLGGLAVLAEALTKTPYFFSITIVGPTRNEGIQALFENKGRVEYKVMGRQSQETVMLLMKEAQILCVPSFKEALGVANIEAMACGLSVVTTHVGGIPEVLEHGQCGWMVPPGDARALSKAIAECVENPSLRLKKQEAGLERARFFSKERLFENFLQILSE